MARRAPVGVFQDSGVGENGSLQSIKWQLSNVHSFGERSETLQTNRSSHAP